MSQAVTRWTPTHTYVLVVCSRSGSVPRTWLMCHEDDTLMWEAAGSCGYVVGKFVRGWRCACLPASALHHRWRFQAVFRRGNWPTEVCVGVCVVAAASNMLRRLSGRQSVASRRWGGDNRHILRGRQASNIIRRQWRSWWKWHCRCRHLAHVLGIGLALG